MAQIRNGRETLLIFAPMRAGFIWLSSSTCGRVPLSAGQCAQLACDALQMALWRRKRPENVIVHTDRGGQYCSADYQALVKWYNLRGSMSAKGCCYDNACAESFFHSLKVECIHGERFISREIMRTTVFDYNRWRRHSACGGISPEQYENQNLA